MATILHLGFLETPHIDSRHSTYEVAEILESKYHVVETFYELNETQIADAIVQSYADAIESIELGAPITLNLAGDAISMIETTFKKSLGQQAYDGVIPGVPTKAALMGRSKRFKRGRNPRGSRPSFIDTGIYQSSFVAWFTRTD